MQYFLWLFVLLSEGALSQIETPYLGVPLFAGKNINEFWLGDYYQSVVYRVIEGKPEKIIDYGTGQGPGEYQTARHIFHFEKSQTLVVIAKYGVSLSFNSKTGEFLSKIINFEPFEGAVKWDDESFLLAWSAKDPKNRDVMYRRYRHDGTLMNSWVVEEVQFNPEFIYETYKGFGKYDNSVFIGNASKPMLFMVEFNRKELGEWPLKPPVGYVKPPKEKIPRSMYYNRNKFNDYMNSFSFMENIFIVDHEYLIVWWHIRDRQFTYDVYDLRDRSLLKRNQTFNGTPIGFAEAQVLLLKPNNVVLDDDVDEQSIFVWEEIPGLGK